MPPPSYVVVWLLFVLAWMASYVVRIGFAALLPPIIQELDLSYASAGVLASAFFWTYALMQIPAGLLGDRFGRRPVVIVGLIGVGLASGFTGLAGSFATLLVGRLLTGACQGTLFSNDRAIIASVTPPAKIALGQGVSFSGPGLGLTLGLLLGGVLGEAVSWRVALLLFGIGPITAASLIWRVVAAPPSAGRRAALDARLRFVVTRPALWVLGTAGDCGIWVQFVLAVWAPLFFVEAGVGDLSRAGALASSPGLAAVAGLITGGWVDDRLRRRGIGHRAVIVSSLLAVTGSMGLVGLVLQARSPRGLLLALLAAAFFVWAMWGPAYARLGEAVGREDLAAAFGLFNTICFLGAIAGPSLTGWARDRAGSFTAGCYLATLVALVGAAIAAWLRSPLDVARTAVG